MPRGSSKTCYREKIPRDHTWHLALQNSESANGGPVHHVLPCQKARMMTDNYEVLDHGGLQTCRLNVFRAFGSGSFVHDLSFLSMQSQRDASSQKIRA